MARLQVIVDGEPKYEGEVPASALPSRPEMFPRALGYGAQAGATPTWLMRLGALTTMVEVIRQLGQAPQMQPMSVEVKPRGMGAVTIDIDMPAPAGEGGAIAL